VNAVKLFVGNVDFEATEREIRDLFLPVAGVEKVEMPRRPDGTGKGFAFVTLISDIDREKAIKQVGGMSLRGRKLRVEVAKPRDGGGARR
jgi:RNA recognition motif-containing protein